MSTPGAEAFDQWLGQQLQVHASTHSGPSPLPAQAQYHASYLKGGVHLPLLAKIGAVLTTKTAIGVTAGVLAVGAASAGEAAITGSVNPSDWGTAVVEQVNECKAALLQSPGSHGIGQCVSDFASQHGNKGSATHPANPGRGHGQQAATPPAKGKPASHPTPPSHAHPTPPKKKK